MVDNRNLFRVAGRVNRLAFRLGNGWQSKQRVCFMTPDYLLRVFTDSFLKGRCQRGYSPESHVYKARVRPYTDFFEDIIA